MAIIEDVIYLTLKEPKKDAPQQQIDDFNILKQKLINDFIFKNEEGGLKLQGQISLIQGDLGYEYKIKGNFVKDKGEIKE